LKNEWFVGLAGMFLGVLGIALIGLPDEWILVFFLCPPPPPPTPYSLLESGQG